MPVSTQLLTVALSTFVVSLLTPFAVRSLLVKMQVVDVPSERSSHSTVKLRGFGLAVLVAMLVGLSISYFLLQLASEGQKTDTGFLIAAGVTSLLSGALGFAEDFRGVSVRVRSTVLLLIAATASASMTWLGYKTQPPFANMSTAPEEFYSAPPFLDFGEYPVWLLVLIGVYGVFFISGFINVANFMDGINGISSLHGFLAGVTFAVNGYLIGIPWLTLSGVVLAFAFIAFLPWNISGRGGFLGDVGSYLLGGSVAAISFASVAQGVPFLATIGPMVIYFGDVGFTLVKRIRAGHKWDEPHKEHTYQRLQQEGKSHIRVALTVTFFSSLTAALGTVSSLLGNLGSLVCLLGGILVLVAYFQLPKNKKIN